MGQARGEQLFGRQHFLDLLSSFASPIQIVVRHGSTELGYVDRISLHAKDDATRVILLAGHSWKVTSIDWKRRTVWVEPEAGEGKARWLGTSRSLPYELCHAIKRVLCLAEVTSALSKRGRDRLEHIQDDF